MKGTTVEVTIIFFIIVSIGLFTVKVFAERIEDNLLKQTQETQNKSSSPSGLRPNIEYDVETLKDPFSSPFLEEGKSLEEKPVTEAAVEQPQPPALTIQGIISGGRFAQAIVNNKVVKEGDTVEEAKIIGIGKKGITVLFKGREFNIPSAQAKSGSNTEP
jgi:hypothetical protein